MLPFGVAPSECRPLARRRKFLYPSMGHCGFGNIMAAVHDFLSQRLFAEQDIVGRTGCVPW